MKKSIIKDSKRNKNLQAYGDIIHLPHHVSLKRPQMAIEDRAAQFSPFSAVVGHEAAVKEAARYTDQRRELDEMEKAIIDNQLREIEDHLSESWDVEIVYFQPDGLKEGGKYIKKAGRVKKIDTYLKEVHMMDETAILIADIINISHDNDDTMNGII